MHRIYPLIFIVWSCILKLRCWTLKIWCHMLIMTEQNMCMMSLKCDNLSCYSCSLKREHRHLYSDFNFSWPIEMFTNTQIEPIYGCLWNYRCSFWVVWNLRYGTQTRSLIIKNKQPEAKTWLSIGFHKLFYFNCIPDLDALRFTQVHGWWWSIAYW